MSSVENRSWTREQRGRAAATSPRPSSSAFEVAEDDERDERHEEHRGHVQVPLLLAEHVAREAEQVAADERRPERAGQVAAEQERRPGGERRHQHGGDVVGRRPAPAAASAARTSSARPGAVVVQARLTPSGAQTAWRDERVLPVQDRVRPPAERPDEDLRVVERRCTGARLDQQAQPEIEQRQSGERGEGGGARPVAAGRAGSGCRRRRNADQSRSRAAAASSASTKSHGAR